MVTTNEPLLPDAPYLVFSVSTNNALANDFKVRRRGGAEYTTNNVWIDQRLPDIDPAVFRRAMVRFSRMPHFYENPLHWAQIWNTIKKVPEFIGDVFKAFPGARSAPGASAIAPYLEGTNQLLNKYG
jgi:hypothetical protein